MAPTYKLTYFNLRARAETIRLILAGAGVKYEDNRVTQEEWAKLKPTMVFGQLPVLEVDGRPLAQSITICRYLAQQHGLAGDGQWERAVVDSLADTITDLREQGVRIFFMPDGKEKVEKKQEFKDKTLPEALGGLEKMLASNKRGDGWLVGDKMTWADLHFYACAESIMGAFPYMLREHPKLKALFARVAAVPKILEHLKSRPATAI